MTASSAGLEPEGPRPVVDVHVHAIPPDLATRTLQGAFSGVSLSEDGPRRFTFPRMAPSPTPPDSLFDFELLVANTLERGIATRLVGPWTDLLGYSLSAEEAAVWANAYNESLVACCAQFPELEALATVPLQSPDVAVSVMSEAHGLGCRGIMIGSDVPDSTLGAAELDVFWSAAEDLGMPIVLHPTFFHIPDILQQRGLKNTVGRAAATAVALTELVYAGVIERHPGIALVICHGGGGFLPLVDRVLRNQQLGWASSAVDIEDSISRLYWDSVVLESDAVATLAARVGPDRVLLGSDYPFPWEPNPVLTVVNAGLSDADERAILGETASTLFDL